MLWISPCDFCFLPRWNNKAQTKLLSFKKKKKKSKIHATIVSGHWRSGNEGQQAIPERQKHMEWVLWLPICPDRVPAHNTGKENPRGAQGNPSGGDGADNLGGSSSLSSQDSILERSTAQKENPQSIQQTCRCRWTNYWSQGQNHLEGLEGTVPDKSRTQNSACSH